MIINTYHNYLDKYGVNQGRIEFISYCWGLIDLEVEKEIDIISDMESLVDSLPFPDCLDVCEVIRGIKRLK